MKELEKLYTEISNSINRGNIDSLTNLLLKSDLIDVTQDECDFFYLPLERDQPEIVKLLIEYFFQKQLVRYDQNIPKYQILLKELRDHIMDWTKEYGCSQEMQQVLSPYIKLEDNSDSSSGKLAFIEEDEKNHSGESTQVTLEDEHSLLSESVLSQYTTEHARDIKDLPVYQAIKALQAVYSKSNDELAINIARDFGIHAGDVNSSHVRVWHKGIQKVIDIYSSISAEVKGVHLSLNSIVKDIITSPNAINCNLDGHEQHINLSGCEYEYLGEDI